MFKCQYCGTLYQDFHSSCTACGATLTEKRTEAAPLLTVEKIQEIAKSYEDAKEFRPYNALSEKKLKAAKKAFKIFPKAEEEIILFCDTHPLGKGKRGFFICEDGFYWQNNWANDTNRNYLSWEDFAEREIKLKGFALELGRGDTIGLAGLGSDLKREKALALLTEIKKALEA